ncbi:hypothetical protein [Planktothrix agardhii]|uniref:hypothetical protein n=1 Tax=Planktothrix agardhii TaxID=1160 RepID=UPI00047F2D82|nr:hypothetical protein [Planktothrix agardhii]CAD0218047.1 conserved hypothetical protein [Planktothrix agardhii]CAD5937310.1 Slr0668 protein [Planktothrix agardhii]
MLKKVSLSGQNLSLSDINDYYVDNQRALKVYFSSHSFNFDSRFANYTINEIETELQARLDELDKLVSFSILSALEASFRIDYLRRCDQKKKDSLSRKMREIYQMKGSRASLEDDILRLWKEDFPEYKRLISEVITAFKYRHWLAHGRYWESKLGRIYDYYSLYDLADAVEHLLTSLN